MNSFQLYIIIFSVCVVAVVYILPKVMLKRHSKSNSMTSTHLLYNRVSGLGMSHLVLHIMILSYIVITCMMLFYYGPEEYGEDVETLELYYGLINGATIFWVLSSIYIVKLQKEHPENKIQIGLAVLCAVGSLVVSSIWSYKLWEYMKTLAEEKKEVGGFSFTKEFSYWVMMIFSWAFLIWMIGFHTILWIAGHPKELIVELKKKKAKVYPTNVKMFD